MNGRYGSFWQRRIEGELQFPPLDRDERFDAVIVGGGITGLTAARALKNAGCKVAVLEQQRIGTGTTGMSSAHLTTLYDADYSQLQKKRSREASVEIARAMQGAIDYIAQCSLEAPDNCEFSYLPGYYIADRGQSVADLEEEYQAATTAGVSVAWTEEGRFWNGIQKGFKADRQAIFDPVKYLNTLARGVEGGGCRIYERTRVIDYNDGNPCTVDTNTGVIRAEAVILATHTPLGRSLLHTVLKPMRSYIIVVRIKEPVPEALIWDVAEPYHYLRPVKLGDEVLLMVGGADNKTGSKIEGDPYERLESFVRERFGLIERVAAWSAQFYSPVDSCPLAGALPSMSNVYTCTGYEGDGLTLGTACGRLVADIITGIDNPLAGIVSPTRFEARALPKFTKMNLDVAKHFIGDRLSAENKSALEKLAPGDSVVIRVDARPIACHKDNTGKLTKVSAVCPHMGCIVNWNAVERTWDCPCHGGRFTAEGRRLEGPPRDDLERIS